MLRRVYLLVNLLLVVTVSRATVLYPALPPSSAQQILADGPNPLPPPPTRTVTPPLVADGPNPLPPPPTRTVTPSLIADGPNPLPPPPTVRAAA